MAEWIIPTTDGPMVAEGSIFQLQAGIWAISSQRLAAGDVPLAITNVKIQDCQADGALQDTGQLLDKAYRVRLCELEQSSYLVLYDGAVSHSDKSHD